MSEQYDPTEQDEILDCFREMLAAVTADGGRKRAAGEKPCWKEDPDHEPAVFSHLNKWKHGVLVDDHSRTHPLVHGAWRMLALAWQDMKREPYLYGGLLPKNLLSYGGLVPALEEEEHEAEAILHPLPSHEGAGEFV